MVCFDFTFSIFTKQRAQHNNKNNVKCGSKKVTTATVYEIKYKVEQVRNIVLATQLVAKVHKSTVQHCSFGALPLFVLLWQVLCYVYTCSLVVTRTVVI